MRGCWSQRPWIHLSSFCAFLKDKLIFSAASEGAVRQSNCGVVGVQLLVEAWSFKFFLHFFMLCVIGGSVQAWASVYQITVAAITLRHKAQVRILIKSWTDVFQVVYHIKMGTSDFILTFKHLQGPDNKTAVTFSLFSGSSKRLNANISWSFWKC